MRTDIVNELSRPFRPIELHENALQVFHLHRIAEDLRGAEEYATSGVSAVTLARDEHMTMVLVALRQGSVLREHRAPSAGTAVLLSGRGVFVSGDEKDRTPLEPGWLAAFSSDLPHAVEALEDSLLLLSIGGRKRPHSD
jgi:quercetin dioxygenase-like cupin family protein